MFNLDFINTLAFGGVVLFIGFAVRRLLPWLARYNVPAPVIGGLLVAGGALAARSRGLEPIVFDTRLQAPLMIAFFTTIGFAASLSLLRGGRTAGADLSSCCRRPGACCRTSSACCWRVPLGMHPLFGVLTGR